MNKLNRKCSKCGNEYPVEFYIRVNNEFYEFSRIPVCNNCLISLADNIGEDWDKMNRLFQTLNIPFIPAKWEELFGNNRGKGIIIYIKMFEGKEYERFGWKIYEDEYRKLQKEGTINQIIPLLEDKKLNDLKEKWGPNYDIDDLRYLEELYKGLIATQNVNGALQYDQAKKLCKISLDIDSRLRAGADFDKILSSYEKLVKIAKFDSKNVKNANDFESLGEVFAYLEKTGWVNKYYNEVTNDIVDETSKNIQNFCQRLYTNETGIGDDITARTNALKNVKEIEDNFGVQQEIDYDMYSNEIIENLKEVEEFNADLE